MVAYNFKKQFADAVESGAKRMTIRHGRKHPTRPGDVLQLYTGLRTRGVRKLLDAVCVTVTPLEIYDLDDVLIVTVGGKFLLWSDIHDLAIKDGFQNADAFIDFFDLTYGLPFFGEIIEWSDQPTAAHAASEGEEK